VSRRSAAAVLAIAGLLEACTPLDDSTASGGPPLPSPASSFVIPEPRLSPAPFTEEDLERVALAGGDTPVGTDFAQEYSVDQAIEEFASDDEELTALRGDGFVLGHVSLFVPDGQLEPDAPPVVAGEVFVQGIAGLFETPEGADDSWRRYVANLRRFQLRGEIRIDAEGLGDTAEGLRGRADGEAVTVYAWRTANLVLVVSGSGTIAPRDVRALAALTQARADRAR